jgi:hypothetical protein
VLYGGLVLAELFDRTRHRAVHAVYGIGGTLLILSWPARMSFAQTPAWESVGRWMAGIGA